MDTISRNRVSVAFLDSGIGGLPYLAWVKATRPNLNVAYYADTAHFPYGELNLTDLKSAVLTASQCILDRLNPELLAIVCNTASVAALEEVRRIAACPVVGTVPAVKPAAKGSGTAPIGLLATRGTVDSPYLDRLVNAFAFHRTIIRVAAGNIVRYVEESWLDDAGQGLDAVLEQALSELKAAQIESLVLGCTHFLHVLDPIKQRLGNVRIVDSLDGVGRRILSLLGEKSHEQGKSCFYLSQKGTREANYRRFAATFNLVWGGILT